MEAAYGGAAASALIATSGSNFLASSRPSVETAAGVHRHLCSRPPRTCSVQSPQCRQERVVRWAESVERQRRRRRRRAEQGCVSRLAYQQRREQQESQIGCGAASLSASSPLHHPSRCWRDDLRCRGAAGNPGVSVSLADCEGEKVCSVQKMVRGGPGFVVGRHLGMQCQDLNSSNHPANSLRPGMEGGRGGEGRRRGGEGGGRGRGGRSICPLPTSSGANSSPWQLPSLSSSPLPLGRHRRRFLSPISCTAVSGDNWLAADLDIGAKDAKGASGVLVSLPLLEEGQSFSRQLAWDGHGWKCVDVDAQYQKRDHFLSEKEDGVGSHSSSTTDGDTTRASNGVSRGQGLRERKRIVRGIFLLRMFRRRFDRFIQFVRSVFLPEKTSVTSDYWPHVRWKFVQRVLSSIIGVFATQSLLYAVGIGARRTLPAAAALNWVLKDGLGKLGKLIVAAKFSKSFDTDLKRSRYVAALFYIGSEGLEMVTQLFPSLFLPIATLANIGKSISVVTYLSTNPPLMRNFAVGGNMGDVTAKGQAQGVVADNLGIAIAVFMNHFAHNSLTGPHASFISQRFPLLIYPFLAVAETLAMWNQLRAVQLRFLNMERIEIVIDHWLDTGEILSPAAVSKRERLLFPPLIEEEKGGIAVRMKPISAITKSPGELYSILRIYEGTPYVMTAAFAKIGWLRPKRDWGGKRVEILMSLRSDFGPRELFLSLLQGAHLRRHRAIHEWSRAGMTGKASTVPPLEALQDTLELANVQLPLLLSSLGQSGWEVKRVAFAVKNHVGYRLLLDPLDADHATPSQSGAVAGALSASSPSVAVVAGDDGADKEAYDGLGIAAEKELLNPAANPAST